MLKHVSNSNSLGNAFKGHNINKPPSQSKIPTWTNFYVDITHKTRCLIIIFSAYKPTHFLFTFFPFYSTWI